MPGRLAHAMAQANTGVTPVGALPAIIIFAISCMSVRACGWSWRFQCLGRSELLKG